jgi:hypothetical protein
VASEIPETCAVTAHLRMAPTAMRKMLVPIPMAPGVPVAVRKQTLQALGFLSI